MAILRNTRKLAALIKENCEEHPRSNLAQNSNAARSQEDYIIQFSEEIEGRVTTKLSQKCSKTESCILGAQSRLDPSSEAANSGPLRNHSIRLKHTAKITPQKFTLTGVLFSEHILCYESC